MHWRSSVSFLAIFLTGFTVKAFTPASPNPLLLSYYNPIKHSSAYENSGFMITTSISNLLEVNSGRYTKINLYLDMELYRFDFLYTTQLFHNTFFSIHTAFLMASTGVMDEPLNAFHSLLGIDSDGRKNSPNNDFVFYFYDYTTEQYLISITDPRELIGLVDPDLTITHVLNSNISVFLGGKIPISNNPPHGSSTFDLCAGVNIKVPLFGDVKIHSEISYIHLGRNSVYEPYLNNDILRYSFSLHNIVFDGLFVTLTGETPRFSSTDTTDLDYDHLQLIVGKTFALSNTTEMFFYISEDVSSYGPAVDVSFGGGVLFFIK